MPNYEDMDALDEAVNQAEGGVLMCTGGDLRHVGGESRLKSLARERIAQRLRSSGLVAFPEIPYDQNMPVYVARVGSPADKLFTAFDEPSSPGLKLIRGSLGETGAVVDQQTDAAELRELIEEAHEVVQRLTA